MTVVCAPIVTVDCGNMTVATPTSPPTVGLVTKVTLVPRKGEPAYSSVVPSVSHIPQLGQWLAWFAHFHFATLPGDVSIFWPDAPASC